MSLPVDRLLAGPAAPPPCAAGLAAAGRNILSGGGWRSPRAR